MKTKMRFSNSLIKEKRKAAKKRAVTA